MQHLSFYVWLISLSIMSSRFIHAVRKGRISFLFIYFGCSVPFLLHTDSLVAASGGYSSLPWTGVFSFFVASLVAEYSLWLQQASIAIVHGLSKCDTRALLLHSMWNLSRSRIKPVSPALAGRFLSTVPPGRSPLFHCVYMYMCVYIYT